MQAYQRLLVPLMLAVAALITAFTQSHKAADEDKSAKTRLLEAGAETLQSKAPLDSMHAHVCGFHFYNGSINRQVIAHHYCSHLTEDLIQCVIYDSDKKDARLMGVEYIISAKLFAALPAEEKKLWHSHNYEVKSGQLIAPRLPDLAEKELMKELVSTYGKTIHTWNHDENPDLPLGTPQLMMGFTADGQIKQELIDARDKGYDVSSADKKAARTDIPDSSVDPAADSWKSGQAMQLEFKVVPASP